MPDELIKDLLRMFKDRQKYFESEAQKADVYGQGTSVSVLLGKSLAYESAYDMLMAAYQNDREILSQYDYFGKEE